MAALKSASRTAPVAFCPEAPLLATGTMAGAIDSSFDSSTSLEIFKLDFQSPDSELPVVAECPTSERFLRLCWSKPLVATTAPLGLIAGALVDGTIGIWDPAALLNPEKVEGALVSRLQRHTGQVRGLEFNPYTLNLLASGADDGELCIWDLSNPKAATHFPPLKGVGSSAQAELSYLSWNRKHHNILASTSYSGTTVVWDLKQQKPVISFPDTTRRRCCVLQWNPELSTQLIIASDDDSSPSLRVWDVRNTISPAKEFVGHSKGVLGMAWCPNDSSFLLTCAKDNRTICWDTVSGEILCEVPAGSNWNFDVQWSPKIRGVLSTSNFDGRIRIYNIESCSRNVSVSEFGGAIAGSGTSALKAPKWLKRPVGVNFGFGGKLASFKPSPTNQGAPLRHSEVSIHSLISEDNMVVRSTEFEAAVADGAKESLRALCQKKAEESRSEDERETWNFLKVMFEEEGAARTKLLEHLGFNVPSAEAEVSQETDFTDVDDNSTQLSEKLILEGKQEASLLSQDNGDDFFDKLESSLEDSSFETGDAHLTQGKDAKINGAGMQYGLEEPSPELSRAIQHSLVVGDYKGAVKQCLAANRAADALIIAQLGGGSLWEKTREEYLKNSKCSYLKVVSAMVNNDLSVLVNSRPLESWKETLALLCTYSQREQWTDLCGNLASRLLAAADSLAATLCYICAGNIDRTVEIWSQSLKHNQEGRSFVDRLQDLMEKTVVLALATGQKQVSPALSKLVETYVELLASQGLLTTAMEYIKLLSSDETSNDLALLRARIYASGGADIQDTSFTSQARDASLATDFNYGTVNPSQESAVENLFTNQNTGYSSNYPNMSNVQTYTSYQQVQAAQPSIPSYNNAGYQQGTATHPNVGGYNTNYQLTSSAPTIIPSFMTPAPYEPTPQVFYPNVNQQYQPPNFAQPSFGQTAIQAPVKSFVPSTPPVLKNADQYQQPSMVSQPYTAAPQGSVGSHLYPVRPEVNPPVQQRTLAQAIPAPPVAGTHVPFQAGAGPQVPFQPGTGPQMQPSVTPTAAPQQAVIAPPTPPTTVENVDTSNVAEEMKPVVKTLTRLYKETSEALGGPRSKREIEDISKRIGSLFAKLNSGDISPNAAIKLQHLCQALDAGDYSTASQIQVGLTTSDWDECSNWLNALKRMIKVRSSMS